MIKLPTDSQARKDIPLATGCLDYFPLALAAVAHLSKVGNDKHNPGQRLHWARGKSDDHADTLMRHLAERGTVDDDGERHSAKVAWRALALLQLELEACPRGIIVSNKTFGHDKRVRYLPDRRTRNVLVQIPFENRRVGAERRR